ncbi:MAG: hypothetical protein WC222_07340 [Parachlamydiales bacterium]|jgi:hypothetical protein
MSFIPGVQALKNWYYEEPVGSTKARELRAEIEKTKLLLSEEEGADSIPGLDTNLMVSSTDTLESPHVVIDLKKALRERKIKKQIKKMTDKAEDTHIASVAVQTSPFAGSSGKFLLRTFEVTTGVSFLSTVVLGAISAATSSGWNLIVAIGGISSTALAGATGGTWYACQKIDQAIADMNALSPHQVEILKTIADGELKFISGQKAAETHEDQEKGKAVLDSHLEESLAIFRDIDLEQYPEAAEIQELIEEKIGNPQFKEEVEALQDRLKHIKEEMEHLDEIRNKVVCKRVIQKLPKDNPLLQSLQGVFDNSITASPSQSMKRPTVFSKSVPITPNPIRKKLQFSSAVTVTEAERKDKNIADGIVYETIELPTRHSDEDMDEGSRGESIEMIETHRDSNNRIINYNLLCARLGYEPKQLFFGNEEVRQIYDR